jgi:hypothetical protein
MKPYFIIFLSCLLVISCKQKAGTEQADQPKPGDVKSYEAAILKIHDATMPKMTELNHLETQVRNIRTKAFQSDQGSAAVPQGIEEVLQSLKSAQNGMLDWMEYYSAMRSKLEERLMLSFMESEYAKIKVVDQNINTAIEKANAWLAEHPDAK